ncbi:MAG: nucleotide sugar dehydrogenase [Ramlibacter sp.]|nr:nucleotide sugar dehydrogenase [Cryobacterium sp.]
MNIVVVALGKIGLPLAVQYAWSGHSVVGADVNPAVVADVAVAREPSPGEAHLAQRLAEVVGAGRLRATTDTTAAVRGAEAVVIVVPLVTDGAGVPDFGALDAATAAVAAGLQPGTLVLFETTLPVGVTRGRFLPALEQGSGLRAADGGLHLAFSPERVLTGRVFADLRRYPKLVGGVDGASAAAAVHFYGEVLQFDERPDLDRPNGVWDLGSAEAAELAKLAETTYRDVNIALANQLALYAESHGIDVHQVIAASNSQPYSHLHTPGMSVGGHCIPVYPRLFLWGAPGATVVTAAREANLAMPAHAVARLAERAGGLSGARVAVLGAAYRAGVKETAFSGVFSLVEEVRARGGHPLVHDPLFSDAELVALGLQPYHLGEPVDAALVHTDHPGYSEIGPDDLPGVRVLLDGRRVTTAARWPAEVRLVLGAG